MEIKQDNIVFLIGAGCSKEAGVPVSNEMVTKIEEYLKADKGKWPQFRDLYNYLKSSIIYSEGIFGRFNEQFNVEKLLIVISELEKRDKNIVFPHIGTWNTRLVDVAGQNFELLKDFRELITNQLIDEWVNLDDYEEAYYYKAFLKFQSTIGKAIRIFSLNHDLCFEKTIGYDSIQMGFEPKTKEWHYSNFDNEEKQFFLYKLHGSINWYVDRKTRKLKLSDKACKEPELIFGIDTKLKSIDPYLYFIYEFRRSMLFSDCRLIISIGFSFSDEHICPVISQALKDNPNRTLLVVLPKETSKEKVKKGLDLSEQIFNDQVKFEWKGARDFLSNVLSKDYVSGHIQLPKDSPFK